MNSTCAHCNISLPRERVGFHILCEACEKVWWNTFGHVLEQKLKEIVKD